ncbi:lytic polysaccharide monooxygenase [Streptomyces lycii]|uniref:Lytic polysaccharide monooxygenase n=2 Tax=Streptomyces lycii TaxID=2654337 RepID=A0ABQ7FJM5_9ACTN|nr:lytic polysaccharide monooxygenase [Streptomyces lycii]
MRAPCHAHGGFLMRVLIALSAAVLLITMPFAGESSAHGSAIDPASRNYGCLERWGDDHQNPAMEQEDPMCWQAWQADPNAMWNWNGLYRENVGGNHRAAVPDGQLCSAGLTQNGRYAAMDTVGDWVAKDIANDFTVKVHDAAQHGADYFLVYVTKQGFDPTTEELGWDDLELVRETGAYAPGEGTPEDDPELGGVTVSIDASAEGRTGRHIVYTIWQAAHLDQPYYLCSDVNFTG